MNIVIQGSNNFSISGNIKEYINKRLEKLNYFDNHINKIHFHLDAEKHDYKVDATLSIKKLGVLKFQAVDKAMFDAIDKIVHMLDVKINREKTRIQDHHGKASHEDLVNFYYEHEKNMHGPTTKTEISTKPVTMNDAYNILITDHSDFIGFYQPDEKKGGREKGKRKKEKKGKRKRGKQEEEKNRGKRKRKRKKKEKEKK